LCFATGGVIYYNVLRRFWSVTKRKRKKERKKGAGGGEGGYLYPGEASLILNRE
jgi:hypothetical protein